MISNVESLISYAVLLSCTVYFLKRLVNQIDTMNTNNSTQHKEFYSTLNAINTRLTKIETEHNINHRSH